jgi:hypothetical protein
VSLLTIYIPISHHTFVLAYYLLDSPDHHTHMHAIFKTKIIGYRNEDKRRLKAIVEGRPQIAKKARSTKELKAPHASFNVFSDDLQRKRSKSDAQKIVDQLIPVMDPFRFVHLLDEQVRQNIIATYKLTILTITN